MSDGVTIDPEFAGLCPALAPEEQSLLEASIESEGCRDSIVVWANHNDTILDGHNRHAICKQFGLPYKKRAIKLDTREDAMNWIIANQLGRRNLTDQQRDYLRGKRYHAEKNEPHRPESDNGPKNRPLRTAEKLAAEYNVNRHTIENNGKFADAVDKLAGNLGQEAKKAILSGSTGAKKKEVIALATLPKAEQKKALAGGKPAIKAAVKEAVEKQRPEWAQGPTPKEEAQNDPGRRWNHSLHKLYVLLTSVRDAGGIATLAKKWKPDAITDNIAELKSIRGELDKWVSILEKA